MEPLKTYACFLKKNEIRKESSSGAVFSALAAYVFSCGGVVYGVAMSDDCYSAEFVSATDEQGLRKLRGSKYLQANVGDTFQQVKADLSKGRMVLFTGVGCQINGLKCFLGQEYDNLISLDVVCHGVPSPALWKEYVEHREKMYSGKLESVDFRCKDKGWTNYGIKEMLETTSKKRVKKIYTPMIANPYMRMFLQDYCLRPSCYECVAKDIKRSDITLADFWGIDSIAPEMNDERGISLVLVRTEKGKRVFDEIRKEMKVKEVSYEVGIRSNPSEYRSSARPVERARFFSDMLEMGFEELARKYGAPKKMSAKTKIKKRIKRVLMTVLRFSRARRRED